MAPGAALAWERGKALAEREDDPGQARVSGGTSAT